MDGERGTRGTRGEPGGPWRTDLGTLLNAEMERHQPDSDRIRARIAASLGAAFPPGPAPTAAPLALVDGLTSPFTPYGELEHDPPVETTAPVAATAPTTSALPATATAGTGSAAGTGSGMDAAPDTSAVPGSGGRPIRGAHGSRIRAGRGGSRRPGRRHGRILVGAAVAGVSMVLVALLAVISGIPGTGSPNPPVTTVTGAPHPIGSPWATTATTEPTSATTPQAQDGRTPPPASAPPPAQTAPQNGQNGQNGPAGSAASGSSDLPAADTTPVTQGRYTSQTVPFPAGSQVRLPTDATDWVLFGDGWNGVRTRAALPVPRLLAFASGSATQKSTSGFTWFGGFPNLIGSDDNERLAVQGRATLSTVVLQSRQLQIYLGASTGAVQITITSLAGTHTFTVDLPSRQVDGSSDAMITLTLPGAIGTTTITVTGVDGAAWTLAAAVLR
ncbi:hypothetical protein [Candidatus Frankia nodulisporulans]